VGRTPVIASPVPQREILPELSSFGGAGRTDVGALGEALAGEAGFPTAAALHPVAHGAELPLGFTIDFFR
jgi:hypothetical protein